MRFSIEAAVVIVDPALFGRGVPALESPGLYGLTVAAGHQCFGESGNVFGIVGHHDHGGVERLQHATEFRAHAYAQRRVQRAERLVQQEETRRRGQRSRQGRTLLLPSRKRGRTLSGQMSQTETLEKRVNPPNLSPLHSPPQRLQAESDVFPYRAVRKKRVVLEDISDAAAPRRPVDPRFSIEKHFVVETDNARIGSEQAGDSLQDQRLSRSGRPEQYHGTVHRREARAQRE
ncbi:MAG: hypothetical protein QNI85_07540, partial [Desulfobacterales bacterium]|nr:hypothetical protein [Desulfobacterales bacterium]